MCKIFGLKIFKILPLNCWELVLMFLIIFHKEERIYKWRIKRKGTLKSAVISVFKSCSCQPTSLSSFPFSPKNLSKETPSNNITFPLDLYKNLPSATLFSFFSIHPTIYLSMLSLLFHPNSKSFIPRKIVIIFHLNNSTSIF